MSVYVAFEQHDQSDSALSRLVRWIFEARERRHQRYAQERAEWINEARNGPTVQELREMYNR